MRQEFRRQVQQKPNEKEQVMADQVSSLLAAGTSNSRGNLSSRVQTYELMDFPSLLSGAEIFVGKKILLAGRLLDLESRSGTSYLEVDVPAREESPKCALVRVIYEGDVLGLSRGSELRIWGTCVGTYLKTENQTEDLPALPMVKADILQWR